MPREMMAALRQRVLVCEPPMAHMLALHGLASGNSSEANLTHPETVVHVHRTFRAAGVDLFVTNTTDADPESLERAGLAGEGPRIWSAGVALCREAAGPDAFVAATVGGVGDARRGEEELIAGLRQQFESFLGPEIDMLLLDGLTSLKTAEAAVRATRELDVRIPVAAILLLDPATGLAADGLDAGALDRRLGSLNVQVVGASCLGSEGAIHAFQALAQTTAKCLMARVPASPVSTAHGGDTDGGSPVETGECAARLIACGAGIIGGCGACTGDHVRQIAKAAKAIA